MSHKHLLRLLKLDLRLIQRYAGPSLLIFFFVYAVLLGVFNKPGILKRFPVVLLLFMLGPFFNDVNRISGEMVRYTVCGADLTCVFLAKNLSLLILSSFGVSVCMFAFLIGGQGHMWVEVALYFSTTIFLLLTTSNYIFVFRKTLGIKEEETPLRRQFFHGCSLSLASIPFTIGWLKSHSYTLCVAVAFLSLLIWYLTTTRHVSRLAHHRRFELLESP